MPRIPCSIRAIVGRKPFPFVTFFLRTQLLRKSIDALIDTGSPFTVLSTNEVVGSRLPIRSMRGGEPVQLAGFRFIKHQINGAILNFRTEEDELFEANVGEIGVLVPTKHDPKTMRDVKHIPSIIGNDFLEGHKLALYYNPSKKEVYLEY